MSVYQQRPPIIGPQQGPMGYPSQSPIPMGSFIPSMFQEGSFIGKFFKSIQDKLQFLFRELQTDFQTIPEGYGKMFLKNGQLITIFLYIVITLLVIIYAIFYRIDKKKLSNIVMPYNIETISYQALDFTHPKYKGKYQYFPVIILVSLMLLLTVSMLVLTMVKFTNIKVKAFYFLMTLVLVIPSLIFIILYLTISKYLKPRYKAKENINAVFYKYMIDDINAKSQLSVIPDGGRHSLNPMIEALKILATENRTQTNDIKQQKLTKAIITFTLYKYYLQKSMNDNILENALSEIFSKYSIKKMDYCKYLPSDLHSLTTFDISKIVLYNNEISNVFSTNLVNKARQSASIILQEINENLDKMIINEDTIKKFIMTNTIVWTIFMIIISIVIVAAMSFSVNPSIYPSYNANVNYRR